MNCQICEKPQHQLVVKKSKLMADVRLRLCKTCADSGFEPRWMIILVGRARGFAAVEHYIKKRLYRGEEVLASELAH